MFKLHEIFSACETLMTSGTGFHQILCQGSWPRLGLLTRSRWTCRLRRN